MSREEPPPPGVSTIGNNGSRTPIENEPEARPRGTQPARAAVAARPQGTARRPGDDVIRDMSKGRVISDGTAVPAGVKGKGQNIVEMPLPKMDKPRRHSTSFTSVDGNTYTFRTHDTRGRPLPHREIQALFLVVIEMAKGGNPKPVLDAFKLKIEDAEGRVVYPFPDHLLSHILSVAEAAPAEELEEGEPGFKLGD